MKWCWCAAAVFSLVLVGADGVASDGPNFADPDNAYSSTSTTADIVGHLLPPFPEMALWVNAGLTNPDYTIRRTVPEVRIQFTVVDECGRLLQSLSGDDVRVVDNGGAVPDIRHFSRQRDLPLDVAILLDVSDSVRKTAQNERQATQFFLQHVFHPESDHASLLAFSSEMREWQPFTSDLEALRRGLASGAQPGQATYLYDSVIRACHEQFPTSSHGEAAQRVLVLVTDGNDTGSLHTLNDAISAALKHDVQIFAVSVHSPRMRTEGDAILGRLADLTGGVLYVGAREKDFLAIFSAMEQQMRTRYAISFEPADRSRGFHDVRIEVAGGALLHVRARRGYFYDAP